VCIGPGPLSERLVRTTRRLAEQLRAEWVAVYVETAGHSRLTDAAARTWRARCNWPRNSAANP